jgi:hypothetical protein
MSLKYFNKSFGVKDITYRNKISWNWHKNKNIFCHNKNICCALILIL